MSKAAKKNVHYVNNRQFSEAVVEYVKYKDVCLKLGDPVPQVPDYVAKCFLKICEGLSHKSNFSGYTYREEMVMDAVENCLRAIGNYDISKNTRTGRPNAFAYFTQISWFAFLRRIEKEKKQQDVKIKYITESGIDEFILYDSDYTESHQIIRSFVDELMVRADAIRKRDENKKTGNTLFKKKIGNEEDLAKAAAAASRRVSDSDLTEFMV